MNYGIQLSASGVLTSMYRQDVFSNNLANMDTVGFKPDLAATMQRLSARQEDGVMSLPSDAMLERLGAGVLAAPSRVNLAQGSPRVTGNPLDVSIEGRGFFQLQGGAQDTGRTALLTRDGRFSRSNAGRLVQVNTGALVLDQVGRPITLPPGTVTIDSDGAVKVDGREVARLGIYDVASEQVRKRGGTVLEAPASMVTRAGADRGLVKQGVLEDSGVDEIRALMQLQSASRDVDANIAVIQQQDRMLDRAINTLGRVS